MGKISIFRLADVGSANSHRVRNDILDLLLRPMLYGMEFADNTFQSATCYLLEMAQVLGFAIRRNFGSMVHCNDCNKCLGTCVGGLESYCDSNSMDSHYASSNRHENNALQAHVT